MAKNSLDDLTSSAPNNALMIPLNQSLYVPGHIASKDKVLVELGTGYFCEKSIPEARDLIDRKVTNTFWTSFYGVFIPNAFFQLQLVGKSMETVESVSNYFALGVNLVHLYHRLE
jgi:hypothetical protein